MAYEVCSSEGNLYEITNTYRREHLSTFKLGHLRYLVDFDSGDSSRECSDAHRGTRTTQIRPWRGPTKDRLLCQPVPGSALRCRPQRYRPSRVRQWWRRPQEIA